MTASKDEPNSILRCAGQIIRADHMYGQPVCTGESQLVQAQRWSALDRRGPRSQVVTFCVTSVRGSSWCKCCEYAWYTNRSKSRIRCLESDCCLSQATGLSSILWAPQSQGRAHVSETSAISQLEHTDLQHILCTFHCE